MGRRRSHYTRVARWNGLKRAPCKVFTCFSVASRLDQIDRTKKIHLADIHAVVAQDGVGHRDVEKGVGDRHLQQVVPTPDDLAGGPGEFDLALASARVLRL